MIQTNWYVITGGPSSGKTTLIKQLASRGFNTAPEVAREFIEEFLSKNHSTDDLRQNSGQLQRGILALALRRERHLNPQQVIFFDRGTADSLGYFNYYHLDASHVTHSCQRTRYKKIFYCQQLAMEHDKVRIEDTSMAQKIGQLIYQSYQDIGYELIQLPAVPVEQRINLIIAHLQADTTVEKTSPAPEIQALHPLMK